jgi:competence protein ComEC
MGSPSFGTDPGKKPPLCAAAPVLWSLLPFIAGILLARGEGPLYPLLLAVLLAACLATRRRVVLGSSLLAGFALAGYHHPPPLPDWAHRPPREQVISLRVEETFNARKPGHLAGIGKITTSQDAPPDVSGRRCAFYLRDTLPGRPAARGDVIRCSAVLTWIPFLNEPDDYQQYLLNRRVFLNAAQGTITARIQPAEWLERKRRSLHVEAAAALGRDPDDPDSPGNVLASMLLGDRSSLSDERLERYRASGTYHLFAVSGLHVGTFALCLYLLARLIRLPRRFAVFPVLLGTWSYIWLTGSSPSAVRAGIMLSCLSLARTLFRQPHPFPALALSAWIVLCLQPGQLFQLGFQLSYGVVAAIILIALPASAAARRRLGAHPEVLIHRSPLRRRMLKGLQGLIDLGLISIVASLVSMPLIVQHFQLFTPVGVLFGILLNPLVSLTIGTGVGVLILAPVLGSGPASVLAGLAGPPIRLMEWIIDRCLALPGGFSAQSWPWPGTGTLLVISSLATAWIIQRSRMSGFRPALALQLLPEAIILAGFLFLLQPVAPASAL